MKNEKIKIMVLRPQARLGLAPQRRFGAQPPKAALGAEMRNRRRRLLARRCATGPQGPALGAERCAAAPRKKQIPCRFGVVCRGRMHAACKLCDIARCRGRVMFILHGRAGVHARRTRLPYNNVFWFVYAMPGVCRGGIYASRQGCAPRGVCGKIACFRYSVGRAFTPAANIAFFKIIGAAGSAPAGASRTGAAAPFRSATAEGGS